ncbi:MAG: glutathione S-transferase family protein [Pseudomonadota bacterium]
MELVSFDLCPFVQRSVITLLKKDVAHEITYIDLDNPPDWFLSISPLGKVPLLRVGDAVLFESAAINEYIDETHGAPLHPEEPLRRAHNRAWIEFASNLIGVGYRSVIAQDEASYLKVMDERDGMLAHLEGQLSGGPYFNGSVFSLADTAFAPLFVRQAITEPLHARESLATFPKCQQWRDALLALDYVQNSAPADLADRYKARFGTSYLYNH